MWKLEIPWYDPVIRGVAFYLIIALLVRVSGKKRGNQFDRQNLVFIILLAEIIQSKILFANYHFREITLAILVILITHLLYQHMLVNFSWFEKWFVDGPVIIILNGKLFKRVLKKEGIRESEVYETLREHEIMNLDQVKCAILESDGNISVIKYTH